MSNPFNGKGFSRHFVAPFNPPVERSRSVQHAMLLYGFDDPITFDSRSGLPPETVKMLQHLDISRTPIPFKIVFYPHYLAVNFACLVEDIHTRTIIPISMKRHLTTDRLAPSEVLTFLRDGMRMLLNHELDEQIVVAGERPFDPHKNERPVTTFKFTMKI